MSQVQIEVTGIIKAAEAYKKAMFKIAKRFSRDLSPRIALAVEAMFRYGETEKAAQYFLREVKKLKRREMYLRRYRRRGERMKRSN